MVGIVDGVLHVPTPTMLKLANNCLWHGMRLAQRPFALAPVDDLSLVSSQNA
jgi:hypothetical protein